MRRSGRRCSCRQCDQALRLFGLPLQCCTEPVQDLECRRRHAHIFRFSDWLSEDILELNVVTLGAVSNGEIDPNGESLLTFSISCSMLGLQ